MGRPVQRDALRLPAVHREPRLSPPHPDGQGGAVQGEGGLVPLPPGGEAGGEFQPVPVRAEPQQMPQHRGVIPSGGAGVLRPPRPAGAFRIRIDVPGEGVGLPLVEIPQPVRILLRGVQQPEDFRPLFGPPRLQQGDGQPDRGVGVLPAVFPHPGRIGRDIPHRAVFVLPLKGGREQPDDAVLPVHQLGEGGVQRLAGVRRVQAAEHGKALGQAVHRAGVCPRRAEGGPVVEEGAQVPVGGEASLQRGAVIGRLPAERFCPLAVPPPFAQRGEAVQRQGQEHPQPYAFPLPPGAEEAEAVVPVPAPYQREPVRAAGRGPFQRPHAVEIKRIGMAGGGRLAVPVVLVGAEGRPGQPADPHIQDFGVAGKVDIFRRGEGEPHQIVGAAGAHPAQAAREPVPPVEDVPFLKLDGGAPHQLAAGDSRIQPERGERILELVPEPPCAAALVEPGAGEEAAGKHLPGDPVPG